MRLNTKIFARQIWDDPPYDMDSLFLHFDIPVLPTNMTPGETFVIVYQDAHLYIVDITRDGKLLSSNVGIGTFKMQPGETGTLIICRPYIHEDLYDRKS